jgi:hypothetical protein
VNNLIALSKGWLFPRQGRRYGGEFGTVATAEFLFFFNEIFIDINFVKDFLVLRYTLQNQIKNLGKSII